MKIFKTKSTKYLSFTIITFSFLITSFTNIFAKSDIIIFNNKNKATVKELPIEVKELFSFNCQTDLGDISINEVTSLKEDDKGNIYILDKSATKIYILDKNMKLINQFGTNGKGPGEMLKPYDLFIMNNNIFISDSWQKKILQFTLDGKFIKDIFLEKGQLPQSTTNISNGKSVAILWRYFEKGKKVLMEFELTLLDKDFKKIKTLNSISKEYNPKNWDNEDFSTRFTVGNNEIFVAEIDDANYKIKVFDFDGNFKHIITKQYRKVNFNKIESKDYLEFIKKHTNERSTVDLSKIRYKKAIRGLYYDKKMDYLIVKKATERDPSNQYDFIVDIFKDGVFLKEVNFAKDYESFYKDAESKLYILFINNSFYAIDEDNMIINKYQL